MPQRDFDAYLTERRKKTDRGFKMFGKKYVLPPTIPFQAVILFGDLKNRKKDQEVSETELEEIMSALIGESVLTELKTHPEFDVDLLTELMSYVLESYGVTSPKAKPEQEQVKENE